MRNIFLHGELGKKFGKKHQFDVINPRQAASALDANFNGFYNYIRDKKYYIRYGKDQYLSDNELHYQSADDIHFIPALEGSKDSSTTAKVVIGIALVATGVGGGILAGTGGMAGMNLGAAAFSAAGMEVTFGSIALMGVAMAAGGIMAMTAPTPQVGSYEGREGVEERKSFLFNGATNSSQQGSAIPLVYGRVQTGSVVVSASITSEQIVI